MFHWNVWRNFFQLKTELFCLILPLNMDCQLSQSGMDIFLGRHRLLLLLFITKMRTDWFCWSPICCMSCISLKKYIFNLVKLFYTYHPYILPQLMGSNSSFHWALNRKVIPIPFLYLSPLSLDVWFAWCFSLFMHLLVFYLIFIEFYQKVNLIGWCRFPTLRNHTMGTLLCFSIISMCEAYCLFLIIVWKTHIVKYQLGYTNWKLGSSCWQYWGRKDVTYLSNAWRDSSSYICNC